MEIWKEIVYDGVTYDGYQVSNLGRVKSLNYNHTGIEKILRPGKDNGYFIVSLCKDGKKKTLLVHRLVATAFLPNPDNKPEVNHKIEGDEGKTMNFVFSNEDGSINEGKTTIEWCTSEENNNYGSHNERMAKTKSKKVLQLTKSGELIREWSSTNECGRNGFHQGAVVKCCNGKRKTHKGFRFMYK